MNDEQSRRGLRRQLDQDLVDIIDVVGRSLPEDADPETTLRALRAARLDDVRCVAAMITLRGLSLSEAKSMVDRPWPSQDPDHLRNDLDDRDHREGQGRT
jgi:hypothetical protein